VALVEWNEIADGRNVNQATLQSGWRVFAGSIVLLIISYVIYFVRYPIWGWAVEPVFAVLISSYAAVLVVALVLLKKDLKKSLTSVFRFHGSRLVLVGLALAFLFQGLWYGITMTLGAKLTFSSFPSLRGYELYPFNSLPLAFALYLAFSTFGAFAEEITYRGYVQTRISAKYGIIVGILVSTLFFSLQHIHIFQLPWIENFFQGQFINVMFGGIVAGYFFFKTKGDIWSVFAFHALGNLFSIFLPIQIIYSFPYAGWVSTIAANIVLILALHFLPFSEVKKKRLDSTV
jgi:membrane protease YdiL (CAAX protease family)